MLHEKVVRPTITYNMESTTNMTNKEMEDMEMIQGKFLREIYNVPPSTPYCRLLIELGMKPIEYQGRKFICSSCSSPPTLPKPQPLPTSIPIQDTGEELSSLHNSEHTKHTYATRVQNTTLHTLNNTVAKGFNQMTPMSEQSL